MDSEDEPRDNESAGDGDFCSDDGIADYDYGDADFPESQEIVSPLKVRKEEIFFGFRLGVIEG